MKKYTIDEDDNTGLGNDLRRERFAVPVLLHVAVDGGAERSATLSTALFTRPSVCCDQLTVRHHWPQHGWWSLGAQPFDSHGIASPCAS